MEFADDSHPYIAERTMRQILDLAERHDDNPLRLTDPDKLTHASRTAIEDALVRSDPETLVRMARSLHAAHGTQDCSRGMPTDTGDLDETSVRLMLHKGLNPLAVAWMARSGEGVEVMFDDEMLAEIDIWSAPSEEQCTTRVHLADGVSWLAGGALALLDHNMPDIVVCALPGKPLSTVFSHPVLDGMDLTIAAVEEREVDGDECTVVTVGGPHRLMNAQDLLEASTPD